MLKRKKYKFADLVRIMRTLRGPKGCAWDRQQNHASLLPYLFEEAHETKRAVQKNDMRNLKEELGDVLLQVLFHAQIAAENNHFTIHDVINVLSRKLIRRHPHVYGNAHAHTPEEIIKNWHAIKRKEKKIKARKNYQGKIRRHQPSSA